MLKKGLNVCMVIKGGRMTYCIIHKGKVIKEYPHRLTCVIWLMLKGLVYMKSRRLKMTKSLTEQQIRKIIENGTGKASKVCEKKFYNAKKYLEKWGVK